MTEASDISLADARTILGTRPKTPDDAERYAAATRVVFRAGTFAADLAPVFTVESLATPRGLDWAYRILWAGGGETIATQDAEAVLTACRTALENKRLRFPAAVVLAAVPLAAAAKVLLAEDLKGLDTQMEFQWVNAIKKRADTVLRPLLFARLEKRKSGTAGDQTGRRYIFDAIEEMGDPAALPALQDILSHVALQAELEGELRQAEEDFARGDFVDVSVEELDRCTAAGEWPWQHASSE